MFEGFVQGGDGQNERICLSDINSSKKDDISTTFNINFELK